MGSFLWCSRRKEVKIAFDRGGRFLPHQGLQVRQVACESPGFVMRVGGVELDPDYLRRLTIGIVVAVTLTAIFVR